MCWRRLPLLLTAAMLCTFALWYAGVYKNIGAYIAADPRLQRMKNVTVTDTDPPEPAMLAQSMSVHTAKKPLEAAPVSTVTSAADIRVDANAQGTEGEILETTIEGGLTVKNETGYKVDIGSLLLAGPNISLSAESPGILIIHTHSSEAYTPAGLDRYEASDSNRTEDTQYNIVRIGEELARSYENAGLNVIHDRSIYDYPSYTGSYSRSGEAVQRYLREYPGIQMVLDVHRDALGANGIIYKTMAEVEGKCASQAMLLVGSDESGLEHPEWRQNMALALYLQEAVSTAHPTLMRPVSLVRERYNQHLCPGYIILEIGSSGNTLQEALAAVRLFGESSAYALLELVEKTSDN